jgi:lysophospholipase L1-like esterase
MKIGQGQTILFTGDSITDCGRARPVGTMPNGLGDGYVSLVHSLFTATYPAQNVSLLNTGISGNRVTDLDARWQEDILNQQPDWLSVMIGINDVWRQFDARHLRDQVTLDRYETVYRRILSAARPALKGLVLMTPYYIETHPSDPMRCMMDRYGRVVKKLAAEFDAVFVDTQAAFDRHLQHQPTQSLCGDRVHPNRAGHMIIARAFLSAIGFDWNASA